MFDAKKLTDDQIITLKAWADDGAQLADIQKRMEDEMELRLTYMDTRFLVLDLGIEIRNLAEEAKAAEAADEAESSADAGDAGAELTEDDLEIIPPPQEGGKVTVTVDGIARPGVMASGRVTFPGGQGGMWYVDEQGRLGVDPDTEGYRPTEADVMAFQRELQAVMDKH
ncbi:MAG: hypothetical protein KJO21_10360 [Verrucomicrobiae bacterium]|nr:hypothetical protein [Verrucomicrobiae bacterium]NNJ42337.1 hypothetical protein [Akkermansiaceae bacterium]